MSDVNILQALAAIVNLGAAGAVIAVVVLFLRHNNERDKAQQVADEKRDEEWRKFFVAINTSYVEDLRELTSNVTQLAALVKDMLNCTSQDRTKNEAVLTSILREMAEHEIKTNKRVKSLHTSISGALARRRNQATLNMDDLTESEE